MDVVWLKRDVRLHDHGPLSTALRRQDRAVLILYLYEPDQLAEPTVHGSHIAFINEGLLDLERRLCQLAGLQPSDEFQIITVCYSEIVTSLSAITSQRPIGRLLAHMETGHMASFDRDKRVRRWCKQKNIPFVEMQQTGVTRCLPDRDAFSSLHKKFIDRPMHPTPNKIECQIITNMENLPGRTRRPLFDELTEIPAEHRIDRLERQGGGEEKAMETLQSFLQNRCKCFSKGISSPNTAWTSCSRLSPFLTWGHCSLRYVVQFTKQRQLEIKQQKEAGVSVDPGWARSLTAFLSRLTWRSHFIQKLESEPEIEKRDLCVAYQHLRRQPDDWNEAYYQAWCDGRTGFPFVDACMRCLHRHGWLNFRMRAMLVSFATYNLWLDWKRIAPHLARLFLDYEPGIHYPQLQMQSGTTGINAMRVYSVTKQGKDQDAKGIFIRKFVPELACVPEKYIHEPWKLPVKMQDDLGFHVGIDYPSPIVDEQESAKIAKNRISQVRKQEDTRRLAQQVYQKHGSRSRNRSDGIPESPSTKRLKTDKAQPSIKAHFPVSSAYSSPKNLGGALAQAKLTPKPVNTATHGNQLWSCHACTFLNCKPMALACEICGSERNKGRTF